MTTINQTAFNNYFSYLCLFVDDSLMGFFINEIPKNEMYLDQLDNIRQVDDPTNIVMALADAQFKQIVECISPNSKESLEKIEMVIYNQDQMVEEFPFLFE